MSITTTSLSDLLPSSIPKLDASGLDWAIFSVRFQDAIEAKGFWSHFDGTGSPPTVALVSVTAPDGVVTSTPSITDLAIAEKWDKDELSAKSLLTQKIPDACPQQTICSGTMGFNYSRIYGERGLRSNGSMCMVSGIKVP